MKRTISIKCPKCGYIKYDLLHLDENCGGLLIREGDSVYCKLCEEDFSTDTLITCSYCGYRRVVDLLAEPERIVLMEVFETYIIVTR